MTGPLDRRTFLAAAAGAAAALGVACSTGGNGTEESTGITRLDRLDGDLAIAALLQSLENLAVASCEATREFVRDGRIEALPPPLATYVDLAQAHHAEHAGTWNGVVTSAGLRGITGVDLALKTRLEPMLFRAGDHLGVATAFLELESVTAATYLSAIGGLTNNAALQMSASIHPVELEHVALLNLFLGRPPVPDAFARVDGARPVTDTIG